MDNSVNNDGINVILWLLIVLVILIIATWSIWRIDNKPKIPKEIKTKFKNTGIKKILKIVEVGIKNPKVPLLIFLILSLYASLNPPFTKGNDFIFNYRPKNDRLLFGQLIIYYIGSFVVGAIYYVTFCKVNIRFPRIFNQKTATNSDKLGTYIDKDTDSNSSKFKHVNFNLVYTNKEMLEDLMVISGYHLESIVLQEIAEEHYFHRWSLEMIKILGENIRPHLRYLWETLNKQDWIAELYSEFKLNN